MGVYMDFLYSSPDSRFQKKSKPPGPGGFVVQKIDDTNDM